MTDNSNLSVYRRISELKRRRIFGRRIAYENNVSPLFAIPEYAQPFGPCVDNTGITFNKSESDLCFPEFRKVGKSSEDLLFKFSGHRFVYTKYIFIMNVFGVHPLCDVLHRSTALRECLGSIKYQCR